MPGGRWRAGRAARRTRSGLSRTRRRTLPAVVLALVLVGGVAFAYWTAGSVTGGYGAAAATSVSQGATPTVSGNGVSTVVVSWAARTLVSGQAVAGYEVNRYATGGSTPQTMLSACTGTVAALTCTEANVPAGSWEYTVTPVFATNWRGIESAKSATVTFAGQAPIAVADGYSLNEDATLTVAAPGVLGNDTDGQADPLTAILASGVANGTLTINASGGFSYVPDANFNGSDSFTYKANDGTLNSNIVTVTLTVTAVNDAPVNSVPGAQQTPKNTDRVFSSANNNLFAISDADAGGSTVQVQLTATNGTVTLPVITGLAFSVGDGASDATMTFTGTNATINLRLGGAIFTPTNNYTGAATLQVITSDLGNTGSGGTLTDSDTITVNVNSLGIFTANADIGGPSIAGSSTYSAGTYTVNGSGANIWGTADQFQYLYRPMAGDGRLTAKVVTSTQTPSTNAAAKAGAMMRESVAAGSRQAMVDIMKSAGSEFQWRAATNGSTASGAGTVGPVNPYWERITRVGNVITGQRSPDGVTWTTEPSAQTVVMNASINAGLAVSSLDNTKLSTVTYDNVAITTPPIAVAGAYSTNEDTTLNVAAPGVLANDLDPESNALTAVLVSGTAGLTLNANGSFAYVPPTGFSGAASFTYKANDGVFDSNTVTVNLTVNPANEVPSFTKGANQSVSQVAGAQTAAGWATTISQGTGESGQLVDFVVTNDNNSLFSVQPQVSAAGALTYTPAGTTGVATVSVRIHDNGGTAHGGSDLSAVQTFTITITTDAAGPTGGSVDASGLVGTGSRYATSTSLSLDLAKGTDPSGVAATGNLLKRSTATLTSSGTPNGSCGSFGTYTTVTGGTDPASPKSDSVTDQACYRYQYVVLDTLGNATTYTSPDIKVDLSGPSAPTLAHSSFTNTYWTSGAVVYYRSAAGTGSFTTTSSSTDTASGIASHTFPALGTNWTSTPGAIGVTTYSWSGTPQAPGTKNVTATNNAGVASGSTSFTPTADDTAPSAGTVTPPNASQASTSVSVAYTTGTDGGSGLGTRLLQRQSATLTGTTCGSYGGWTTAATNPGSTPFGDTVTTGFCYRYQYVVSDNVGNTDTATSGNVVKVSSASYLNTITGTPSLLSYWRLGEATTSSDSFTGTAGVTIQSRAGETGATWTKHAISGATNAVLSAAGRAMKNGAGTLGATYYSSAVPASADYTVEADVYVASSLAFDAIGLIGRVDTANANGTFYTVRYDRDTQLFVLYSRVNGSWDWIGQSGTYPLSVGATYRVALDMTGSTIRVLVDGAQVATAVSTTITAPGRGGFALGHGNAVTTITSSTGMHLDNFLITPPLADNQGTNPGDYVGGPTLGNAGAITGDANASALFDGVNDYGTVARQISDDFSIEFWFKSSQVAGSNCAQWGDGMRLVDADVAGGNSDFGVSLCAGKIIGGVGNTSDVSIVTPGTYNNNAWHHVVFTRTRSPAAMELYVDGTSVIAGTPNNTGSLTASGVLSFGRAPGGGNYFSGLLDEISIYTSVLTSTQVAAHYAAAQ